MKFATFKRHSTLIHNRLKKLFEYATTLSEVTDIEQKHKQRALSVNFDLTDKQKEYSSIRDNLLNTPNSVTDSEDSELATIDSTISDLFFDIHTILRPLLPSRNEDSFSEHNTSVGSQNQNSSNVRLPKIQLKTFSGDISQWIAFQNVFEVTVHKNQSLTNIEKFQYLLSCLTDEPFNLIKALPLTNENYSIAYDTLSKRYHNPRILKSLHINHLIDMPSCTDTSAKQLRNFISQFNEHSSALSSLNINLHEDNPVLITLLLRKFDTQLRTRFETKRENSQELPTPKEFIEFLENECSYMENAHLIHSQNLRQNVPHPINAKPKSGFPRIKNVSLTTQNTTNTVVCSFCNQSHVVYSCQEFLKLTPSERFNFVKANHLCVNCLGTHKHSDCSSKSTCRTCNKRHHTFLHLNTAKANNHIQSNGKQTVGHNRDKVPGSTSKESKPASGLPPHTHQESVSADTNNEPHSVQQSVCTVNSNNALFTTLLGTTLVKLSSSEGTAIVVRALVDSASTCTFINTDVVNKLQLNLKHTKHTSQVNGISATPVNTKGVTNVNVSTLGNKQISNNHPVLVLSTITSDMPSAHINDSVIKGLSNFKLADPNFYKRGPIQMLIGADLFMQIMKPSKYSLGENMPYALDTEFGFIVIGKTPVVSDLEKTVIVNHTILHCLQDDNLDKLISNFWTLEQPPEPSKLSEADIQCEKHFAETHRRDPETGKYTVKLPFKENPEKLGESSLTAKRRFFSLERKLNTNPDFKQLYTDFMSDYESTGHMSLLTDPLPDNHYFLPHHGVLKESSSSTRLRVVFDASSKTTSDLSLNDILHVGPKLHNDISTIITNFRRYRYVFTTDVKQMFRSIDLDTDDRCYQLIYWRDNPQKTLSIYQLNTVTYGLSTSPFLANRVVQQLTQDEEVNFFDASQVLRKHIYVDDVALGADTIQSALSLQSDVKSLLEKGGFHLRKWTANHEKLLKDIPKEFHEQPVVFRTPEQPLISILGLQWIPSSDCFTYKINIPQSEVYTKRVVLSDIAKIFDPCGFLSPVVIKAKIFIQTLWTRGLGWDSPLPSDLTNQWTLFTEQLHLLENVMLPRHFKTYNSNNIQLHGFCDSSELAFSACVYLRVTDSHNNTHVTLILAKTRVAPLKRVSLPRLELCGAHLLAQLMHFCSNNLLSNQVSIDSIHAWTDSTVTLNWISTQPYKLKTYVANRVSQIQEWLPVTAWSHVPSQHNPADCASRGIYPQDIITHTLWWSGPQWLKSDSDKWPRILDKEINRNEIPELKQTNDSAFVASHSHHEPVNILSKYSSWTKLQRVIAFMLRFAHNTRHASSKITGTLSSNELQRSVITICKTVQQQEFTTEYEHLKKNKVFTSKLQNLSPFLDENGLIRVGGRLKNAHISSHAKHPILLPKSGNISSLIVDYYHLKNLHAGPQLLQSLVAQHFWILSARSLIRSRIHKCLTCFRHRPRIVYPLMGNLPEARVNPSPSFKTSGLDYAGPFEMKVHTLRRAKIVKCYVCLFVCFATKAIHIELVSDLSSDTFIAALTRFVSRRGVPTDLYLDNATNFVGASNYFDKVIKSLLQDLKTEPKLQNFSTEYSTKFHFIPPSAPHQGGIWESGVKSMKTHLKRVIGDRILTQEEFLTLCTRIEAILNSRPLCPISSDPSEIGVLTPGHFLIGRPMLALPELDYEEVPSNRLKRWQAVQAITQQLWKRWKREYLHTLQQRAKWTTSTPNLEVDDLVLLHSNSPPQSWPIGRITATHPGTDGVTRVVTIRTSHGVFTRPVVKVSPLPK